MLPIATATLSPSKQIAIPEEICQYLNLQNGSQFLVMGEHDMIILKPIHSPSFGAFETLREEARQQGERAGLRPDDILQAVTQARSKT